MKPGRDRIWEVQTRPRSSHRNFWLWQQYCFETIHHQPDKQEAKHLRQNEVWYQGLFRLPFLIKGFDAFEFQVLYWRNSNKEIQSRITSPVRVENEESVIEMKTVRIFDLLTGLVIWVFGFIWVWKQAEVAIKFGDFEYYNQIGRLNT